MTNADTPYLANGGADKQPCKSVYRKRDNGRQERQVRSLLPNNVDIDIHTKQRKHVCELGLVYRAKRYLEQGQLEICRQLVDTGSIMGCPDMLKRECLKVKIGYGAKYQTKKYQSREKFFWQQHC